MPLVDRPLHERKTILAEVLAGARAPLLESTYVVGEGKALFASVSERGLEGVVAKRRDGRYLVGERSDSWQKLKVRRRVDGVLVGLVRERGAGRVKSLVLGAYEDGRLRWVGNVGSGLDQATIEQLGSQLDPLAGERPPGFDAEAPGDIEWLRPALVVRAEYAELTRDRRLRHPVFLGFVDKRPEECQLPERD